MGAFGCKLREKGDWKKKRARDEEDTEDTSKKSRVEESDHDESDKYESERREWLKRIQSSRVTACLVAHAQSEMQLLLVPGAFEQDTFEFNDPEVRHVFQQVCDPAGDIDFNHIPVMGDDQPSGRTVFMLILHMFTRQLHWITLHERLLHLVQTGVVNVNVVDSRGGTALRQLVECRYSLLQAVAERSTPAVLNSLCYGTTTLYPLTHARNWASTDEQFNFLRRLQSLGCDLNVMGTYCEQETIMHTFVRMCHNEMIFKWMQIDFEGIDWQIQNTYGETFMKSAYQRNLDEPTSKRAFTLALVTDWDNRWRSVTKTCVQKYILPDLSSLVCQYLDGTGPKFLSRKEIEEQELADKDLEDIINGTKLFVPPA